MLAFFLILLVAYSECQYTKGGVSRRGKIYVAVSNNGILLNEANGGAVVSSATVSNGVFRLRSSFGNARVHLTGKPFVVTNDANGKLVARYFTEEDKKKVDNFQKSFQQQMDQLQQVLEPSNLFGKGFPFNTKMSTFSKG